MMIVTNTLAYYIFYGCKSFIVQVTTALMSKNIWDTKKSGLHDSWHTDTQHNDI
jgi:hypothetical protein